MLTITWQDVAWRLALAALSGAAVGFNRGEHGRAAGLRTTLLVCLAAAVTMVQANLLLFTRGRLPDAFTTMDVMRLPLGILSGVGFIGAGAILRRQGEFVHGVTTAATLWYVIVMGLCYGGGQTSLGLAALALGLTVLWGFKLIERRCKQDHRAWLTLETTGGEWTASTVERRRDVGWRRTPAKRHIARCVARSAGALCRPTLPRRTSSASLPGNPASCGSNGNRDLTARRNEFRPDCPTTHCSYNHGTLARSPAFRSDTG